MSIAILDITRLSIQGIPFGLLTSVELIQLGASRSKLCLLVYNPIQIQYAILVGGFNPSEKYESQIGSSSQLWGKIKFMFQTTNQTIVRSNKLMKPSRFVTLSPGAALESWANPPLQQAWLGRHVLRDRWGYHGDMLGSSGS